MGNYTMIADTSAYLVELLQKALVPELISDASEIGLRSPEEKGDIVLGVFLYDVRQSEEVFQQLRMVAKERISKPPLYLSLCYMITAYGKGDTMYRLMQEEQILGRVIQIFYDNSIIPIEWIDPQTTSNLDLHIQMINPDIDEKSKIWSFPNIGNRLSLFYKVSPIAIDSAVSREFSRVTEIDIHVRPKLEK
mgnify:CR=1 FL=1